MSSYWEGEFDYVNFGFKHTKPHIFVTSQCGPTQLYPVWTVVALLYHVAILIADGVQTGNDIGEATANYFLYLPNWSYLLLTLYALYDCVTTLYVHLAVPEIIRRRESSSSKIQVVMRHKVVNFSFQTMGEICTVTPQYLYLNWALFTLTMPVVITVSITYWATYVIDRYTVLPVDVIKATLLKENTFDFSSLAFHAINSGLALLHICICAKPFRLLHFYFPLIFFVVYIAFTLVYQLIADEYIYKSVDWDNPFITVSAVAGYVMFVVPLVHLLVHAIVYLRSRAGLWCQLQSAARKIKRRRTIKRRNSRVAPINKDAP